LEQLPVELGGASQTIGAEVAHGEVASLLEVPAGSPVLVAQRVTRSSAGRPVLVSRHVFPAHRTQFDVELPAADATLLPTGLRLVE
ncbi:MAG: UTRA domain-containing protein, partial [Mycobacteriaceae bacterium]|nr:UTRA domain-containing protein [Mycobacteriaceae bacterium]